MHIFDVLCEIEVEGAKSEGTAARTARDNPTLNHNRNTQVGILPYLSCSLYIQTKWFCLSNVLSQPSGLQCRGAYHGAAQ